MKKFHKRRGMIVTQLSAYEVELLASLIMQLIELLSDGEPEGFADQSDASDAFEEIVKRYQRRVYATASRMSPDIWSIRCTSDCSQMHTQVTQVPPRTSVGSPSAT